MRVIAMSTLQSIPLTKELAEIALRDIIHRQTKNITIDDIIAHVSKAFHVKPADIKSKKKHKLYSSASPGRHVSCPGTDRVVLSGHR